MARPWRGGAGAARWSDLLRLLERHGGMADRNDPCFSRTIRG
ncbi:hypothetical protein ACQW02_10025 [Humitalea sp. 24SJ18S-53]